MWPDASEWLETHGLHAYFELVHWTQSLPGPSFHASTNLRIELVDPGDAADYAAVCCEAFNEPLIAPWLAALVGREGWRHYMTLDVDRPVGTCVMFMRDGGVWLGWSGTLLSHRNQGSYTALVARMLADAVALGASWARCESPDDVPHRPKFTFRSTRRAGFEILERRAIHAHVPPGLSIDSL
ncbi:MAG: hypothetical protein ACREA0_00090 [bacterium]